MIASLLGAFINVTILTRLLHWILRRKIKNDSRRSYLVFISVAVFDLSVWSIAKGLSAAFYNILYFYLPFLVLWLLFDLLEVSKRKLLNG